MRHQSKYFGVILFIVFRRWLQVAECSYMSHYLLTHVKPLQTLPSSCFLHGPSLSRSFIFRSFILNIMDTVRSRQKRWLSHILTHDSLLRITLEGQIQGKKAYGRPRTMLLDWLLKTEEGNISYEELKMSAQDRSRWSQWSWKPAIW